MSPLAKKNRVFYFEITITKMRRSPEITIGLALINYGSNLAGVGMLGASIGFCPYSNKLMVGPALTGGTTMTRPFGPYDMDLTKNPVIGCGYDKANQQIFFTCPVSGGVAVEIVALSKVPALDFYPTVTVQEGLAELEFNFGQKEFALSSRSEIEKQPYIKSRMISFMTINKPSEPALAFSSTLR